MVRIDEKRAMAKVGTLDRAPDGNDGQTEFFTGKTTKSNPDGFVIYVGTQIFGVKWQNGKAVGKELDT